MLRFGKISDIDADNALVKVAFGEDDLVSEWIPTTHAGTSGDSYFHSLENGTAVACAMSDNLRYGCVIGAIYSNTDSPQESGSDIVSVVFDNGDKIVIDKQNRTLTCNMQGGLTINGDLTVNGSVDATDVAATNDVTASGGATSLTTHTHTTPTTGQISDPETTSPPL